MRLLSWEGLWERPPPPMASVDSSAATQTLAQPATVEGEATSYLIVFEEGFSRRFELPSCGDVLIGRGEDTDLVLQDSSVSRHHARLSISEERVVVTDLGSHNGTQINDERVEGTRIVASGDSVGVGSVLLILRGPRLRHRSTVLSEEEFVARLDPELIRAVRFGRSLVLGVLAAVDDASLPRLGDHASSLTVLGRGRGRELWALMPELDPESGAAQLRELAAALGDSFPVGMASCPGDGCEAEALLAAARADLSRAGDVDVRQPAQVETQLEVGSRRVLVADPVMRRVYELLRRLSVTDLPVLIHGETGAGKENAAFAVHAWSKRADKPFLPVNCAALQDTLLESELFGHERGAFTGAVQAKMGLIELANGGTLFLDEVAELTLSAQAKLLRVLETGHFTRVGGTSERSSSFRIVAATHRQLERAVQEGRFRQDLYFRLATATVVLPPLRDRPVEIPLLARELLAQACAKQERPLARISGLAMSAFSTYAWPGNVRELKSALEYAAAAAPGEVVEPEHLPPAVAASLLPTRLLPARRRSAALPLAEELRALEQRRMREALEATDWVQTRAAEVLGMPLRTFVFKLKRHGLAGPRTRQA